ncbi:MAG: hypothetical protein K1000chlam2_00203 [Chlamydiae bacterium]|nr:hypothetical protein [Chlamydiota bacterium]
MTKLASVINFCTHDLRFLDKCIRSVASFSDQIVIPVCDHFYNGKPEDLSLLQRLYHKYPDIDFIEFAYSEEEVYGTPSKWIPQSPGWAQHWHNSARLIGTYFLHADIDYVLFLDVDEIFAANLRQVPFTDYASLRFATYWYFKTARQCATVYPDGPLLIRRDLLTTELLLNEDERMGMFFKIEGKKEREYVLDGKPLVHHYSWVRTKEEMLQKVRSWGHHWERDWEALMETEGDFVRGYEYKEVEPYWDPLQEEASLPNEEGAPLKKVTPKDIFLLEIAGFL